MIRTQFERSFSPPEIIKLVTALGSDPPRATSNGDLIFQTICHNPPHTGSYKLFYYQESGLFHCYTQCGDSFDIYELVKRVHHCNFGQALDFVQQTLGISFGQKIGFEQKISDDWEILDRYSQMLGLSQQQPPPPSYEPIPHGLLDLYPQVAPAEWMHEWITPEACKRFNIRFDVGRKEIIIPHYDHLGNLIGIRSRCLDEEAVAAGFKYIPTRIGNKDYRHTLRYNLYGLDKVKTAVQKYSKILLGESEKLALQCASFYGEDSFGVAVCGSNISTFQRDMIVGLGVKEVFLAFDKEYHKAYSEESDLYADKILKLAGLFTPYATTYVLWDSKDLLQYKDAPTDRGKEVLEQLMKEKFEITTNNMR